MTINIASHTTEVQCELSQQRLKSYVGYTLIINVFIGYKWRATVCESRGQLHAKAAEHCVAACDQNIMREMTTTKQHFF